MPEESDLLDFMLKTHTRLFHELGLDETHFDQVATCFVKCLESFQVDQDLIDECVAIIDPFRVVFEYGSQVATKEKEMTAAKRLELPLASAKTIGTDIAVCLPEYSQIIIPKWLPDALGKKSSDSVVRSWTCELTNRFGAEGDKAIADTFLDQAYMDHHVYLVAFLELAFMPEGVDPEDRRKVHELVLYPRGPKCAPLSKKLFRRMIVQFVHTCHTKGMARHRIAEAKARLSALTSTFAARTEVVGGINGAHVLSRSTKGSSSSPTERRGNSNMKKRSTKWIASPNLWCLPKGSWRERKTVAKESVKEALTSPA